MPDVWMEQHTTSKRVYIKVTKQKKRLSDEIHNVYGYCGLKINVSVTENSSSGKAIIT